MSEQASNDPSEARPRFQFSLRTLMGFTAAVAPLLGMWSWRGELGVLQYFQGVANATVRPEIGFRAAAATTDTEGYVELNADLPMLIEECETIVGTLGKNWVSFENISAANSPRNQAERVRSGE